MITKYNKYVDSKLNEELELLTSLKNLFGKMLQNVTDEIKKPIDDLTKKISKTKDLDKINKYLTDYLKVHHEGLNTSIEGATSIIGLIKVVKDNLTAIYVSIDAVIKNLGDDTYTFEELFKGAPEQTKSLFSKSEKRFNKNVGAFSEKLVASFGKAFKFDKNDEEFKEEQEIAVAQGDESGEATEKLDNFNKLKESIIKWFENTLYKAIKNEMKSSTKDKPSNEPSTATSNTAGVKKMATDLEKLKGDNEGVDKLISGINQLSDPKQLATIRELLVKMGYGTADDYGKF